MSRHLWLLPVALLLFIHTALIANGISPVLHGKMPDTDTYMWLVRIENFINGQNWFDSTIWRMNTPYGMSLHWSHPLDMLIIGLAWPAHALAALDWHTSIFWAGALTPVLLHIIFALTLGWMIKPLFPKETLVLIIMYAAIQPVVLAYNLAGRPDHQTLLMIAGVGLIGLCVRTLDNTLPAKKTTLLALAAGVVAGFGLWVSSEFELTFVFIIAPLALFWLIKGETRALKTLATLGLSLVATVFLAVLFERGISGLSARELDKISLSQLVAVTCFAALFTALYAIKDKLPTLQTRFLGASLVGTLALCALAILAPEIYRGPSGDMDPRVVSSFAMQTSEMQSLWPTTWEKASLCALWAGPAILGVFLWLALRLRPTTDKRWMVILPPALAYMVIGLMHARFMQLAAPLGALFLVDAGLYIKAKFEARQMSLAGTGVLLSLLLLPLMTAILVQGQPHGDKPKPDLMSCAVTDIAPLLNALPPSRIFTLINYGPEILYRTPHSVVSGPYHRNTDGLADNSFFLTGPAPRAEEVVRRRGIDYVLLCNESKPLTEAPFATELLAGKIPSWLEKQELPESSRWQLFKVRPLQPNHP